MAKKYVIVMKDGIPTVVFLKLVQLEDRVELVADDSDAGVLLSVSDRGVELAEYFDADIGFPMSKKGTIKRVKDIYKF